MADSEWITDDRVLVESQIKVLFADMIQTFGEAYLERGPGMTDDEYDAKVEDAPHNLWALLVRRDGYGEADVIKRTTYDEIRAFTEGGEGMHLTEPGSAGLLRYCLDLEHAMAPDGLLALPHAPVLQLRPGQRCWSFR